jgi:hypothetical protein
VKVGRCAVRKTRSCCKSHPTGSDTRLDWVRRERAHLGSNQPRPRGPLRRTDGRRLAAGGRQARRTDGAAGAQLGFPPCRRDRVPLRDVEGLHRNSAILVENDSSESRGWLLPSQAGRRTITSWRGRSGRRRDDLWSGYFEFEKRLRRSGLAESTYATYLSRSEER